MGRKVLGVAKRIDPTRNWPVRWRILLSLALIVASGAVFVQNVLAVHDTGAFQLDGDATTATDPYSGDSSPSPFAVDDWDKVCYEAVYNATTGDDGTKASAAISTCGNVGPTSGATAVSWTAEPSAASTIFTGGGSKDPQPIGNWLWKDDANNPPDKDNLIHAYAARYSLTPSANCPSGGLPSCEVLYFGSDRFDNSGDAQQAFWFLQAVVAADGAKSGGGFKFTGEHKPGDVLAISDFSIGGTTSTITVYKWDPPRLNPKYPGESSDQYIGCTATNKAVDPTNPAKTVTDTACKDANLRLLADLQGAAANCRTTGNADAACGIVNPITITMPWQFEDKTPTPGNGALNGEFYEAGLNLSMLGLADECFSSVVAETRSSTSTTATLKDFVVGQLGSCETALTTVASYNAAGTSIIGDNTSANGTAPSGTDTATLQIQGVATWSGTLEFYICGPSPLNSSATCNANGVKVLKANETTGTPVSNQDATHVYTSGSATLTAAGRYCWFAKFTPDAQTLAKGVSGAEHAGTGAGTANPECFVVAPVVPTLTTLAGSAVTLGSAVTDTATLVSLAKEPGNNGGNASYPTINATNGAFGGTIRFTLKGPDGQSTNCTTNASPYTGETQTFPISVNVTGNGSHGPVSYTPSAPGTYHWVATLNGPLAGGAAINSVAQLLPSIVALPLTHNGNCNDTSEDVIVQQIPTQISTGPWTYPQDTATVRSSVSGGVLPTGGSITFKLFGAQNNATALANCQAGANSETVNSDGLRYKSGPVTPTFNQAGTEGTASTSNNSFMVTSANSGDYYWRVTYAPGGTTHTGSQSACVELTVVTQVGADFAGNPVTQ